MIDDVHEIERLARAPRNFSQPYALGFLAREIIALRHALEERDTTPGEPEPRTIDARQARLWEAIRRYERDQARRDLKKYGRHLLICEASRRTISGRCTCGLAEALPGGTP